MELQKANISEVFVRHGIFNIVKQRAVGKLWLKYNPQFRTSVSNPIQLLFMPCTNHSLCHRYGMAIYIYYPEASRIHETQQMV